MTGYRQEQEPKGECEMENESVTEKNKTQKRSRRVMSQNHTLKRGECKSRLKGGGVQGR